MFSFRVPQKFILCKFRSGKQGGHNRLLFILSQKTVSKQYRIPWSGVSCFSDLLNGIVYFYKGHPVVFYELWGLLLAIKYKNKFGY
jgi:hypothetical protein